MLSLVNYDDSDESEKEEEGDMKKQQSVEDSSKTADVQVTAGGGTASTNGNPSDIQAQLLTNASKDTSSNKKTVKISIPSLKEFDDEPSSKKSKLFHGGTGLLNMLPAPKNASLSSTGRTPLLLPHVLNSKSKPAATDKSEPNRPKLPAKSENRPPVIPSTKPAVSTQDDNDEPDSVPDDKSNEIDFFGISQKNKEDETALSVSTQVDEQPGSSTAQQTWDANSTENASFYGAQPDVPDVSNPQYAVYGGQIVYTQQSYDVQQEQQPAQDSLDDLLKDEGFLRLQGKKHRGKEDIQVIDVSADQQIMDAQEWVMKNLTEEKTYRPFRRRSEMPSSQHRRKHQITYLAFQAKERELELKNQWAQNRLTRRETQAKYGF